MIEAVIGILGSAFLGTAGWAIHLGSRVSVIESQRADLITLINTKFDEVSRRLSRIEQGMNGHLRGND